MIKTELQNGINIKLIKNPKTPRIAMSMFFKFSKLENRPGLMSLLNRLLLQGTQKRSAEDIANELDENAIELLSELKNDFLRLRIIALNEDFKKAVEILEDIIKNSTFENFEKEVEKMKGELSADLDSAKAKAQDNYYNTIFEDHPYGFGSTKILDNLNNLTKEDVKAKYKELLETSQKNICVAGDINHAEIKTLLENHFANLPQAKVKKEEEFYTLKSDKISCVEKEDANQAQIHKGWILPPINDKDFHKFMLLNTILGGSGMTSRLFYELREKKGLAYVVRSTLEANSRASLFTVYIATEPKNITTCIEGFDREIKRIQTTPLTDEELESAKNNLVGRRQFYYETNMLTSIMSGQHDIYGFSDDYEEALVKRIEKTTKDELMEFAKKYFSTPSALSVLAPAKYLAAAGLK